MHSSAAISGCELELNLDLNLDPRNIHVHSAAIVPPIFAGRECLVSSQLLQLHLHIYFSIHHFINQSIQRYNARTRDPIEGQEDREMTGVSA